MADKKNTSENASEAAKPLFRPHTPSPDIGMLIWKYPNLSYLVKLVVMSFDKYLKVFQ